MKRIVLLAPGVAAPWTEGRKIFVRDVATVLRSRGIDAHLLDGAPATSPARMILAALSALRTLCKDSNSIDAVITFPYGTFHGFRGAINAWLLRHARAVCSKARIAHMPLFYSCVGLDVRQLGRRFGPGLAVGRSGPRIESIQLGIRHPSEEWRPTKDGLLRLLFLCGYQKTTPRALHDVLHERGLVDLLDIGNALASDNIRLTVAVPFLRDPFMRDRLRVEIDNRCPKLDVDMQAEVNPYALFSSHDAFVFPYRREHSVFVPTSLLEALSIGIPVVAADHAMYRELTVSKTAARCALYQVGDAAGLLQVVRKMQVDYDGAVERARIASAEVRTEWTVDRAVEELLDAINAMAK